MALLGTLCAYYRPHKMVTLKRLKYGTLHWNKNIVSFEIQILTKIRQSEIISTILTSGTEIIA